MFYRYGFRIFNLKHVQEIYIRDFLFGKKYILGIVFTSHRGNITKDSHVETLVFDDEYTIMKEFNKIIKMIENKDQ